MLVPAVRSVVREPGVDEVLMPGRPFADKTIESKAKSATRVINEVGGF